MHRLWHVVEPILESTRASVIVEIGAGAGKNTAQLLEYSRRHRATCHVIDPSPSFDVPSWKRTYGNVFVFHERKSLDVLAAIPAPDVVLIDGDHNWYTVFHELTLLEEQVSAADHVFPLVLLHDVEWPYGRRDLYYDPDSIPIAYRHPFRRAGMRPGKQDLLDAGGLNERLANAVVEGGPRNGVRTAVDDFIQQTALQVEFLVIPGLNGLGVLTPAERRAEPLKELLTTFRSAEFLLEHCRLVEMRRVKEEIRASELRRSLKRAERRLHETTDYGDRDPTSKRASKDGVSRVRLP